MYGFPPHCPYMNRTLKRPQANQNPYNIDRIIPVYLGGEPGSERIVIFTKRNGMGSRLQVQKFDYSSGKWISEYQQEVDGLNNYETASGYWEAVGRNVVVIYYSQGSGSFLTYVVLGRRNGKLATLVNQEDIFQGSVWIENGKLFEQYGNRYRVWISKNGRLVLVPYKLPIIPGSYVIRYSISPSGVVNISKKNYTVPVGSTVQVIRTDLNSTTERILYSYTPVVKNLVHKSGFKFLEKGMLDFTIIPDGYDWEKSVNVVIEAK